MKEHIPVFRPTPDPESVWKQLRPVIESGWLGQGPKVEELEVKLAAKVGAKHFVTTSSCTAALHLAVHCLDLPKGSRVFTSPISFVSTNAVLLWEGLVPVFGEVTYDGMLKWPYASANCDAIMVVHLGGAYCHPAPWYAGDMPVIEDCAHAFGAPWVEEQGPNMRCWSFHAVKGLPMGDGGGVSTNDDDLAARLRRLRWMGIDKSTYAREKLRGKTPAYFIPGSKGGFSYPITTDYDIPELGWKYQMNDITAAIGLAALPLVDEQVKRRQEIANRYYMEFWQRARVPSYEPALSACHFYPFFFEDRQAVEASITADNIAFSRHYKPNFLYEPFSHYGSRAAGLKNEIFESAMEYYRTALILPLFPSMTDEQVERVIAAVRRAL